MVARAYHASKMRVCLLLGMNPTCFCGFAKSNTSLFTVVAASCDSIFRVCKISLLPVKVGR
jgi:hypothetical protein